MLNTKWVTTSQKLQRTKKDLKIKEKQLADTLKQMALQSKEIGKCHEQTGTAQMQLKEAHDRISELQTKLAGECLRGEDRLFDVCFGLTLFHVVVVETN